ncbi:MAG: hydroxyacid dehydrogenase [Bacteroidales bacterium]|jgi:D-3-phosphoglycerate dehydrogenase|nr:hydroxyacid dehydrogenase [Bacteroidales bacterium]
MKIVAVEPIGVHPDRLREMQSRLALLGHDLICYSDRQEGNDSLVERMKDADIVIISNIVLRAEVLSQCSCLKMISVAFTGLDHIDLSYCRQHHIHVSNASGYATVAVCELTIGLILDVYRRITFLDAQIRKQGTRNHFLGRQLSGKTVGIVGTGAIGTQVALSLKQLGCNIVAWSKSENKKITSNHIPYFSLDRLLALSDIVSLHLPLTEDTFHLINRQKLSLLKRDAILINTARGNIVDMNALSESLVNGTLAGAGIDVFEKEPPLPENHPLLQAPNCILVPHIGYATEEAFEARAEIVFDNIFHWLEEKV